ncbi:MAG: PAS domain-containing protein [Chloroflexi bacterium]|nr:MAG: PAS domain-containing protein [Chloroflexota bacterium]MBA4375685.1 hypothetical protein [Anaerolinea sp.]
MTKNQLSDYTRRLEHLLEVCKNLTAALDLEPLLNSIIEVASDLTRSEWSQILVYDTQKKYMQVMAAPFYMLDSLKTIGVPVDRSIAGRVLEIEQPMVYHKSEDDAPVFQTLDWETKQNASSVLAVPMIYKGEVIGVIESINKINDASYSEEDVFFLDVLASQAATAIQNYRLIQKSDQAFQKAMELDRMKSDFIAIASHELRTPLGLIMGHASFLTENATKEQKADVDVISRSAVRLKDLIDEFSDIDAITSGFTRCKREKVYLDKLAPEVVETMRPLSVENKVRLTVEVKQPNLVVEGDFEKITLALRNLVKNALNFTNAGGAVKVTVDPLPGYVKIAVMDNGIGIPAAEQQNIFKRFYQVEKHLTRKHGGMGLGLAIAKEMVEMHGGKIAVESMEEKGSRFTILLPLNAAQVTAAERVFLS